MQQHIKQEYVNVYTLTSFTIRSFCRLGEFLIKLRTPNTYGNHRNAFHMIENSKMF